MAAPVKGLSLRWRLRDWPADAAGRKNMLLLIQLRWLAVVGQLITILAVHFGMGIALPLPFMLIVPFATILLNLASLAVLRRRTDIAHAELFLALLFDVVALAIQLFLSGGATNPFVSLFLLQVVLGAILLDQASAWIIVAVAAGFAALLSQFYQPLRLPPSLSGKLFTLHIAGTWVCFTLIAILLMMFLTRINHNLKARDAHLADLRQQAAEEGHIVRMGLLASGAAHELGTPLSSLAVALNDWRRMPALAENRELIDEIDEMQAELRRCKAIVTGILLSAGEARGEAPRVTTIGAFLDDIVIGWGMAHSQISISCSPDLDLAQRIVSDPVIKQAIANLLDNAEEAGATRISIAAHCENETLVIAVHDDGQGFDERMLADFGKPYNSSKGRQGGGLGLFLVVNVVRKLGGDVTAANRQEGGATVTLRLPRSALAIGEKIDVG